jgi:beta-lactamase regulating signal transducer with metallopeptidase domain
MITWGITYLIHSSLLISAVWLGCRFLRSTSARETLWKIALVAPLVTATLPSVVPVRETTASHINLPRRADLRSAVGGRPASGDHLQTTAPSSVDLRTIAVSLWIAGAALMLLRLLIGRLLFARALRDRVDLLREHDRLAQLRAAMRCRAAIRLTESSAVGSPIAMPGWEIVVPRGTFARLSDEQKETILAHEIAHLQRRDPLWLLAGETIKALFFMQPLAWLAHAKMKECAEYLCDDVAVRQTRNPRALAETLADLAGAYARTPRAVAAMAEGGSNLTARVSRVLSAHGELPMPLIPRLAIAAVAVVALAAFAPAIGMAPPIGAKRGFLRVRQTSSRGPAREIDATPAKAGHRVGGVERPWDDEARRLILSAFRAEKAYAKVQPEGVIRIAPRERRPDPARKLKTWSANVELVGTHDHVPTSIRIKAANIRYDEATAEVFFDAGGFLDVLETSGDETRTFHRDSRALVWSGPFGDTEVSAWLANILHEQTKLQRSVATAMGRE